MPIGRSDIAAGYLAGIIDGEGSIAYYPNNKGKVSKRVVITNTDMSIIRATAQACDVLGITYKIREEVKSRTNRKDVYALFIYGKINMLKIRDLVPIRAHEKQEKLAALIASYGQVVTYTKTLKSGKEITITRRSRI